MDSIFQGLFSSSSAETLDTTSFLICIGAALGVGIIIAFVYAFKSHYTKSFILTLVVLPAIVAVVIMMVNGNIGAGVATAGAFSLVRFRSVPGKGCGKFQQSPERGHDQSISVQFDQICASLRCDPVGPQCQSKRNNEYSAHFLCHLCSRGSVFLFDTVRLIDEFYPCLIRICRSAV